MRASTHSLNPHLPSLLSVRLLRVLLLQQASLLADSAGHVRHLVIVAVSDACAMECSHQVVHLLAASDQRAEGQLVVGTVLLDLTNLIRVRSTKDKHHDAYLKKNYCSVIAAKVAARGRRRR